MPNGDPDFHEKELPQLEAFFGRIASPIIEFAGRHNLKIQRYYHDAPSWQLVFKHPRGGAAHIDIRRDTDQSFRVLASWWVDDYERFTRSIRNAESGPFPVERTDIERILRDTFESVLSWRHGEWTMVSDARDSWGRMSKKEFETMGDIYPSPRI